MKELNEEIDKYVDSKSGKWSPRSVRNLRSILRTLHDYITSPDACFSYLSKAKLSRYSIKTYFLYAGKFEQECWGTRKFYNFLKGNAAFFRNCYKEKTRTLKAADFDRCLKKTGEASMVNLLMLMGRGGLRWSEALNVKHEDLREGLLWVVGKGDKQRKIPFDPSWLMATSSQAGLIVEDQVNIRIKFKALFAPFTPHDFRAYYATQVANNPKLGIKNAAMLLGHSSIVTTNKYVRADIEHCKQVLLGGV